MAESQTPQQSPQEHTPKEIVIKLNESTYAHYFHVGTRIHELEYNRVLKMIESQLQKAIDVKNSDEEKSYGLIRHHNTISIFGGRGSGKTSFLHTIFTDCATKYGSDIEILKIIDPTLIETRGHVFLWVLSLIDEKVQKVIQEDNIDIPSKSYQQRRHWKTALHNLAKGIHALENVGVGMDNSNWHDDDFVAERGLQEVKGALFLEKNFRELVSIGLEILNKKAFLLAFDDIDVDMAKGWSVLETIRKYLTSDKIIVLLSGNLRLYSLNVRKRQWHQLQELQEWEGEKDFKIVVSEIEGQYLMKLLKAENRVYLHSIQDNIRSGKYIYKVMGNGSTADMQFEDLTSVYKKALAELGIISRTQSHIYSNYLLSLSVRSQMHFLRGIDISSCDYKVKNEVDPFMARMYAANIDIDYAINNPQMMNMVALKYLLTQNFDLYLLIPTVEDEDANGCVTGLSFLFAKKVKKNPFLIFDYFIRIGYTRNMLSAYEETYPKQKFCTYSGMFQDMSLKNIVGLSIAFSTTYKLSTKIHIPLYGLSLKQKNIANNRIDAMLRTTNLTNAQKMIALIPLCSIKHASSNNSSMFYSTIVLLAAIGQVLRCVCDNQLNGNQPEVNDILRELKDMQQHRYYVQPQESEEGSNAEDNIEDFDLEMQQNSDTSTTELTSLFIKWGTGKLQTGISLPSSIPPYLLGKIITRYMNAVPKINVENLGARMHFSLVSLLNSCLIEEVKEYYEKEDVVDAEHKSISIEDLNFSNTIEHDQIFIDNLTFVKEKELGKVLKLTKWLIVCPLVVPFIKKDSLSDYHKLLEIDQKSADYKLLVDEKFSLYEPLRNVFVKQQKEKKKREDVQKIRFTVDNIAQIEDYFSRIGKKDEVTEKMKWGNVGEIKKYVEKFMVFSSLTAGNIRVVRQAWLEE